MIKQKLVVLSGAGISEPSGIQTFRDANGLWEGHDIMEVASIEGWHNNPEKVLEFYNQRRRQLHQVKPNTAHEILAKLESVFEVNIITQNVDDLHERAGSTEVLHLHGQLFEAKSSLDNNAVLVWKKDINIGDFDQNGNQLRPNIVWFGEEVPNMSKAIKIVKKATTLIVIGTSLQVYPAAGLIDYCSENCKIYYIDKNPNNQYSTLQKIETIKATAIEGLQYLETKLTSLNNF